MLINSIKFVVFAALVVFLYYIVPLKKRWIVLLVSSYIFYFLSSKYLIVFILLSTLSIYLSGILIGKQDDLLALCEDKEKKKELKRRGRDLEKKREDLKKKQVDRKTVSKLKEKQYLSFVKEQNRIEQLNNDEFALYAHMRNVKGGENE